MQQQDNGIDDFVNISFNSSRIVSVEPGAFQGKHYLHYHKMYTSWR